MENAIKNILTVLTSLDEAQTFAAQIDQVLNVLFREDFDIEADIKSVLSERFFSKITTEFPQFLKNKEESKQFLENLREAITKLKILRITMAFEPTVSILERIGGWIRANMGEGIIMDITIDPAIIGGASFSFEGKYREFILKDELEFFFTQNKEELLKCLD